MSQDYTDDCFDPGHAAQTDMANIEKNFAALKSCFSGPSQPTDIVPGMLWFDTSDHMLRIRNEANTGWQYVWNVGDAKPFIANLSKEITLAMMAASAEDPVPGTAGLRSLGTGSQQACAGNDSRLSNDRTPITSSVSQSKLKTTTASTSVNINNPNTSGETGVLPGGEYGFRLTIRQDNPYNYDGGFEGLSYSAPGTGYTAPRAKFRNNSVTTATYYAQERYVQSSGEVHWVFLLKNRDTGVIEKSWQAPDHCCFGNGDDPGLFQHPYGDYDQDKYELIVINPPLDLARKINAKAGKTNDFIGIMHNEYEIDELSSPPWPTEKVTIGLPGDWEEKWMTKEYVKPLKSIIPKPKQAVTRVLKKIRR
jgi:hypothetical protein